MPDIEELGDEQFDLITINHVFEHFDRPVEVLMKLVKKLSPIGKIYVIIRNNNKGATNKKALILFFFSAFLRLSSKGIPSVVKILFVSLLINKKGRL